MVKTMKMIKTVGLIYNFKYVGPLGTFKTILNRITLLTEALF